MLPHPPSHLSAAESPQRHGNFFFPVQKSTRQQVMALFFLVAVAVTLSRHKYPTGRKATTELSAHNKMSVDFSTAELRTILRAHPGRKRDGTVRPRGEQAIRTMMSAITTHYRRVHGESSGSCS